MGFRITWVVLSYKKNQFVKAIFKLNTLKDIWYISPLFILNTNDTKIMLQVSDLKIFYGKCLRLIYIVNFQRILICSNAFFVNFEHVVAGLVGLCALLQHFFKWNCFYGKLWQYIFLNKMKNSSQNSFEKKKSKWRRFLARSIYSDVFWKVKFCSLHDNTYRILYR